MEQLPRVNPQWGALVTAAALARDLFLTEATGHVRNQPGACLRFILAMLDDAGVSHRGAARASGTLDFAARATTVISLRRARMKAG